MADGKRPSGNPRPHNKKSAAREKPKTGPSQSEETLRASEERYRSLVELTSDIIYISDALGNQVFMNAAGLRALEALPAEVIGLPWLRWIHPDDRDRSSAKFMEMIERGIDVFAFENRYVSKTGQEISVLHNVRVLRDSSGGIAGTQGIARDIGELKRTERALKESEQKFRTLAEKSPNMIFINQAGRVVYANELCSTIMGYAREELYAPHFNFLSLIAPEHLDLVKENFAKHMRGIDIAPYEYGLVTKDGKRVEAIITTKVIEYDNRPAILGIITDITERKRMETALLESGKRLRIHAEELGESNSALRVLLKQRENDKREIEEKIMANIRHLILPYIAKLKRNRAGTEDAIYLNLIESNLNEIVSPLSLAFSSKYARLTPREIMLTDLIKDGKQDKEIAEILNISLDTVKAHRKNIRKKLAISGKRSNLRSHLLSLSSR